MKKMCMYVLIIFITTFFNSIVIANSSLNQTLPLSAEGDTVKEN